MYDEKINTIKICFVFVNSPLACFCVNYYEHNNAETNFIVGSGGSGLIYKRSIFYTIFFIIYIFKEFFRVL